MPDLSPLVCAIDENSHPPTVQTTDQTAVSAGAAAHVQGKSVFGTAAAVEAVAVGPADVAVAYGGVAHALVPDVRPDVKLVTATVT